MKFRKICVKNFMSVGSDPLEIDFEKYEDKSVVVIKGKHLDISETASNGSGKSLLYESVIYCLFGKTLRGLSNEECINNTNKKDLDVIVYIDDLKIERRRKPNKFLLYKDSNLKFDKEEHDITQSSMAETQEFLERELNITFEKFINDFCLGSHNFFSFISASKADKRIITENLLQLSEFNEYEKKSRDYFRLIKKQISDLEADIKQKSDELLSNKNQLDIIEKKRENYLNTIKQDINSLKKDLEYFESKDYSKISKEWEEYDKIQLEKSEINSILNNYRDKILELKESMNSEIQDLKPKIYELESAIKIIQRKSKDIQNMKPGVECDKCHQKMDPSNYSKFVDELKSQYVESKNGLDIEKQKSQEITDKYTKEIKDVEREAKKYTDRQKEILNIKKPELDREIAIQNKTKIEEINKAIKNKESDLTKDPYEDMQSMCLSNINNLESEILELEKNHEKYSEYVPYYEFWTKGFGELGIKSFVIEQIRPTLNSQINFWLQYFVDNHIKVEFDKYL
ncbi:MAG: AAA family ATPase, partial [Bacillota bacterium]